MDNIIRIRIGDIEIEGNENFVKDNAIDIIEQIFIRIEKYKYKSPTELKTTGKPNNNYSDLAEQSINDYTEKFELNKSGPDLVIAAALKLTFTDKKDKFSRTDIISEMKKCTGIYKPTMISNLTKTLNRLKKNKLISYPNDIYALTAEYRKTFEANL